ncbi:MAG: dephospho-CoA kinase [Candidatus Promineifilaceae bacterium]
MNSRWPNKIVVGLTGNIATGKSAILRLAAERGALALDADHIVHELLDGHAAIQQAIVALFGPAVGRPDGRIDRAALGEIVFRDPAALKRLERVSHPAVRRLLFQRIAASDAPVVFIEAIKLLEGSLAGDCDQVWVARCAPQTQLQRLIVCRGLDEGGALARLEAQGSQAEKAAQADVVIETDGTLADTEFYFALAWAQLLQLKPAVGARARSGLTGPLRSAAAAGPVSAPAEEAVPAAEVEPAAPAAQTERMPAAAEQLEQLAPPVMSEEVAPAAEVEPDAEVEPAAPAAVSVRRARLSDAPSLALLIHRATGGLRRPRRTDLLMAFGDRGYLIGQEGLEISALAGWNSDNAIARIEQFYVSPPAAAAVTGAAVLAEIERTAAELTCEVIFAAGDGQSQPEIKRLLETSGFQAADPALLPKTWQTAVADLRPGASLLVKVLRDTRLSASRTLA